MIISKAIFSGSSVKLSDRPALKAPEFAFIGRSNVGKSSLINMLTDKKELAHTSSKPGKTQLINHFFINEKWYLVDLPGYGFAKVSKTKSDKLYRIINNYISNSDELVMLFVLLDSRLDLQKIDIEFITVLKEAEVPFSIIFTKGDKLSKAATERQLQKNKRQLAQLFQEIPPIFLSSSQTKMGKEEILNYIETTFNNLK